MKAKHVWMVLIVGFLLAQPSQAAGAQTEETAIVESATVVLDEIMAIPIRGIPQSMLTDAEGVVIVPSWQEYEPREGEVAIRLDPGMAFGTGLHPTTRMALIALERYLGKGMR